MATRKASGGKKKRAAAKFDPILTVSIQLPLSFLLKQQDLMVKRLGEPDAARFIHEILSQHVETTQRRKSKKGRPTEKKQKTDLN